MNQFRAIRLATAATLLTGATLSAPVRAAPVYSADVEIGTVTVEYGDLNLASKSGVDTLHHRLVAASKSVCDDHGGAGLADQANGRACQMAAMDNAMRDLRRAVATAWVARRNVAVASAANN